MSEAPKELWTPEKKEPERVRNIAMTLFLEYWKSHQDKAPLDRATVLASYRECKSLAKDIIAIEEEKSRG